MSIIQGVGYPNPNRSHFRSMDIWHSAAPEKDVVVNGWLGRYFDNACAGCDPHVGVAIGEQMPLAMKGDRISRSTSTAPKLPLQRQGKGAYLKLNKIESGEVASAQPSVAPRNH
jgi:uncharacterized protein (DUF1501 family)